MKKKLSLLVLFLIALTIFFTIQKGDFNPLYTIGEPIDSFHGVPVFYNGSIANVEGRNVQKGYNLGLKYQCVEFVKRYYFEHFNHKMPDSYGHAKDFYNPSVKDGELNEQRNVYQFSNPSQSKPKVSDLLIMDGSIFNKYGHVGIVSKVMEKEIEIIQQNAGPFSSSRKIFRLIKMKNGNWKIDYNRILGWLRMKSRNDK